MVAKCPADNTQTLEQNDFWDGHWDAHKVGLRNVRFGSHAHISLTIGPFFSHLFLL